MRQDYLKAKTDKRVKLSPDDKVMIKKLYDEGWGIRELSRRYEVNKRSIQFILFPERLEHNKELRRKRLENDPQRYYDKETHKKAIQDLRERKRNDNLDLWKRICPVCKKEFVARVSTQVYCSQKCMWTMGNWKRDRGDKFEGLIKGDLDDIIASLPPYCELSGSRALGLENENSDWDFYVPENRWDEFKEWAIKNISPNFTSVVTGQIGYYVNKPVHNCLIEFSYLFPKNKKAPHRKVN